MGRLWEKGESVDERVLTFTVGNDPALDRELLSWDCIGSAAHARMLCRIGLLSTEELGRALHGLAEIFERSRTNSFPISMQEEDCHTAIENELTRVHGEVGAKIHTGRSRNDQVLLAMRLLMRDAAVTLLSGLSRLSNSWEQLFARWNQLPMPGYTHLQPGMPSSIGMWVHAFAEQTLELMRDGCYLVQGMNSNPLGAASGFDVPLPLDRALVASLLEFDAVQRSPIDVQNSRGRYERKLLFYCTEIGTLVERVAWDLSLYCSREFGFVTLPSKLTTGSSIMPQKRNPDVVELLRARAGKVRGCLQELDWVFGKLPSNYHRDLQLTKEPLLRGVHCTIEMLGILPILLEGLEFNRQRLEESMWPELYATYEVYAKVRSGMPFREAYRAAAAQAQSGQADPDAVRDDFAIISAKTDAAFQEARRESAVLIQQVEALERRFASLSSIFQVRVGA